MRGNKDFGKLLVTIFKGRLWVARNMKRSSYQKLRKRFLILFYSLLALFGPSTMYAIWNISLGDFNLNVLVDPHIILNKYTYLSDNKEIVDGHYGDYYIINVHEALLDEKVTLFELGQYKSENEEAIREFLSLINDQIIAPFTADGYKVEIFLMGHADSVGFKNDRVKYQADLQVESILFLERLSNNKYSRQLSVYKFPEFYNNADLPFFRAQYIKNILSSYLETASLPKILEGEITERVDEEDRNTQIIIFKSYTKEESL